MINNDINNELLSIHPDNLPGCSKWWNMLFDIVSKTNVIDKYYCPFCILRTLQKRHFFLNNFSVFAGFEKTYPEVGITQLQYKKSYF